MLLNCRKEHTIHRDPNHFDVGERIWLTCAGEKFAEATWLPDEDEAALSQRIQEFIAAEVRKHNEAWLHAEHEEVLEHYSWALDEIWLLRSQFAREALVLKAHLGYKGFPKSRRVIAETQIERMVLAAQGRTLEIENPPFGRSTPLKEVGAPEILTRHQWENPNSEEKTDG